MLNTSAVNWCYYHIPIKFPKPWSIYGLQLELIPGGFELHGDDGELWGATELPAVFAVSRRVRLPCSALLDWATP